MCRACGHTSLVARGIGMLCLNVLHLTCSIHMVWLNVVHVPCTIYHSHHVPLGRTELGAGNRQWIIKWHYVLHLTSTSTYTRRETLNTLTPLTQSTSYMTGLNEPSHPPFTHLTPTNPKSAQQDRDAGHPTGGGYVRGV